MLIRSIQQLDALRDDWNELADSTGHALLRHEWVASAAATLVDARHLTVVADMEGGRLAAVAPLAHWTVGGIARLGLIGAAATHEPSGFLYRDAPARSRLLDELFRLQLPVVLQRMIGGASTIAAAARRRGFVALRTTQPWLGIDLSSGGIDLLASLPGKLRYDVRRARARASELGEWSTEVLAVSPVDADAAVDRFIQVEASGWKRRAGSALAVNHRLQRFFRVYVRSASEAGIMRVFFLRIGGRVAAAQLAAEVYDRLWVLKIGYDEAMRRCSPGLLLTAEAIAYAARRKLRGFEFLGSPESWEARWPTQPRGTELLVFYPWNLRGCAGLSIDTATAVWRGFNRRVSHAR